MRKLCHGCWRTQQPDEMARRGSCTEPHLKQSKLSLESCDPGFISESFLSGILISTFRQKRAAGYQDLHLDYSKHTRRGTQFSLHHLYEATHRCNHTGLYGLKVTDQSREIGEKEKSHEKYKGCENTVRL
ncbi:hypothetical protein Pelo_14650 [Pelomyxa schiedti]|nr:hypothetical protein Pelo_14650 [Pelomyxa schiedti]